MLLFLRLHWCSMNWAPHLRTAVIARVWLLCPLLSCMCAAVAVAVVRAMWKLVSPGPGVPGLGGSQRATRAALALPRWNCCCGGMCQQQLLRAQIGSECPPPGECPCLGPLDLGNARCKRPAVCCGTIPRAIVGLALCGGEGGAVIASDDVVRLALDFVVLECRGADVNDIAMNWMDLFLQPRNAGGVGFGGAEIRFCASLLVLGGCVLPLQLRRSVRALDALSKHSLGQEELCVVAQAATLLGVVSFRAHADVASTVLQIARRVLDARTGLGAGIAVCDRIVVAVLDGLLSVVAVETAVRATTEEGGARGGASGSSPQLTLPDQFLLGACMVVADVLKSARSGTSSGIGGVSSIVLDKCMAVLREACDSARRGSVASFAAASSPAPTDGVVPRAEVAHGSDRSADEEDVAMAGAIAERGHWRIKVVSQWCWMHARGEVFSSRH